MPIPILLYHSVSDDAPEWIRPFSVTPQAFRRQLELIRAHGATALSVTDYAEALGAGRELPERPVVITFDDGLADFGEQAMPALADAGLIATLFVTTGFLEGASQLSGGARPEGPWLDAASLREVRDAGIEIGAHSHSHPHLDTLSAGDARREIATSKDMLEQILEAPVPSFAYPHGYLSRTVRRLVRECGFASACAVKNAFSAPTDDVFALARLTIRSDTPPAQFAAWLAGRGAPAAPPREAAATRAWRLYRRSRSIVRRRPGSDWA